MKRVRKPSRVTSRRRVRRPNRNAQPRLPNRTMARPSGGMDRELVRLWERTFEVSRDYYTQEKGPEPPLLATNCAWKAVLMKHQPIGVSSEYVNRIATDDTTSVARFDRWERRPERIAGLEPNLVTPIYFDQPGVFHSGPVVGEFGRLLEFSYLDQDANFRVARFREPGLPDFLWDDQQKCVLSLPGLNVDNQCTPVPERGVGARLRGLVGADSVLERGAALVEKFMQRPPRCFYEAPKFSLDTVCVGMMDAVVYRSDKWGELEQPVYADHPRNPHPELQGSREYLHQDQFGVVLEQSLETIGGSKVPALSVVRGGRLDAYKEGLVY